MEGNILVKIDTLFDKSGARLVFGGGYVFFVYFFCFICDYFVTILSGLVIISILLYDNEVGGVNADFIS